jgi:voltage-gated sodium channel
MEEIENISYLEKKIRCITYSIYFGYFNIFLSFLLIFDIILAAFPVNSGILIFQTILISLFGINLVLLLLSSYKNFFSNSWNILDLIYFIVGMFIFTNPAIAVFRFINIFRITRIFKLIRKFKNLRDGLYIFSFIMQEFLNQFTIRGTSLWIFVATFIITHIYTISSMLMFGEELPELFGTYGRSLLTLVKFTKNWDDVEDTIRLFGIEYLLYFMSFYIIIIMGFFNGLVGTFGNSFTNIEKYEYYMEVEEESFRRSSNLNSELELQENFNDNSIKNNSNELYEKLNNVEKLVNLICKKLNIEENISNVNLDIESNL